MKFLFTLLLFLFVFATAFAVRSPRLRVVAARNARVEILYTSKFKETTHAVFIIINAEGKIIRTQNADLSFGENSVLLDGATVLAEGTYTVELRAKKKVLVSRFIIWN